MAEQPTGAVPPADESGAGDAREAGRADPPAGSRPPAAERPGADAGGSGAPPRPAAARRLVRVSSIAEPLLDDEQGEQAGIRYDEQGRTGVIVELNLFYVSGLADAEAAFGALFRAVVPAGSGAGDPKKISKSYVRCRLSRDEMDEIVRRNAALPARQRPVYRIWADHPIQPLIDLSVSTVKADAAQRSYSATGQGITWAVIDSGIDGAHPHFSRYQTLDDDDVRLLHRDFTRDDEPVASALIDADGHGTHVAGIIAGALPTPLPDPSALRAAYHVSLRPDPGFGDELDRLEARQVEDPSRLAGVAPRCKLVSLKVLDEEGKGDVSRVMRALSYIREDLNHDPKLLRVHGVNLSLGYPFNARWFACGQSPICVEVDRLVRSGVVVVVAAGNTGYGDVNAREGIRSTGLPFSINDPGNAALAITVGATHRDSPHTYGVSYFSSKGPTGDGRLKPDLVAPGERITSCAAGKALRQMYKDVTPPPTGVPAYVDHSGTSMAAPHVSGAVAAFLSIRREYSGRPEDIKQIFLDSATSLGREPYFQGRGLVDLMRAIQSV